MITLKDLTNWIDMVIDEAKKDTDKTLFWFNKDDKFSIVAGWTKCFFEEDCSDLFYLSKSNPEYAMSIKIITNDCCDACTDFDALNMPVSKNNEVDDVSIILEQGDNSKLLSIFFLSELDRIILSDLARIKDEHKN